MGPPAITEGWRAIRDIIKQRCDATVMLLPLDQAEVPDCLVSMGTSM
jgi:hypothetical protein